MTEPGELDRACRCVLPEPPADRPLWTDDDHKLVADVEDHGWHVVGIDVEGSTPAWAFTVGLWHTFGHPELAMFGLRSRDMAGWLDVVGEQIRGGHPLEPNQPRDGVLPNHPVVARTVDPSWYVDLFGYALWLARGPPLPFLQVGDLPMGWEAEYEAPDGAWVRRQCPPEYWLDP